MHWHSKLFVNDCLLSCLVYSLMSAYWQLPLVDRVMMLITYKHCICHFSDVDMEHENKKQTPLLYGFFFCSQGCQLMVWLFLMVFLLFHRCGVMVKKSKIAQVWQFVLSTLLWRNAWLKWRMLGKQGMCTSFPQIIIHLVLLHVKSKNLCFKIS